MKKSIRSIAASSREAIQTEKAMQALATMKGAELQELANDIVTPLSLDGPVQNVTAQFLKVPEDNKPKLPESEVFVYRGALNRLCALQSSTDFTVGVLAGKDSAVLDVILADTVDTVLKTIEVQQRWFELKYEVYGLSVFQHVETPENYRNALVTLPNPNNKDMLLLAFDGGLKPTAWTAHLHEYSSGAEISFSQVAVRSGRGRQKDETFTIVHVKNVGVEFEDQAWFKKTVPKQKATQTVVYELYSN